MEAKTRKSAAIFGPERISMIAGWVYVMHCLIPAVVKIGVTRVSVESRRLEHSKAWGAPLVVDAELWVPDRYLMEAFLVTKYLHRRVWRREWFAIDTLGELVNLVKYGNLGNLQQRGEMGWLAHA
jgi:hypothetical protein